MILDHVKLPIKITHHTQCLLWQRTLREGLARGGKKPGMRLALTLEGPANQMGHLCAELLTQADIPGLQERGGDIPRQGHACVGSVLVVGSREPEAW